MEGFDSGFDASGLTLLSEIVALFDSNTESPAPSASSSEYAAIEILTILKTAQKKGSLLSDLEKTLLIPKRKRSPASSLVRVSRRTDDLLDLYIPKKRRTARRFLKRKSEDHQCPPGVKRQKITHDDMGMGMGMPSSLMAIKSDLAAIKSDFRVIKSILDLQLQLRSSWLVRSGC